MRLAINTIHGVKILSVNNAEVDDNDAVEQPNAVTLAAMKEAEEGNDAGVVCVDSLERFMDSMNWTLRKFEKLAEGEDIPSEFKPHLLRGNWKNYMECHVGEDYLLIWYDKEDNVIKLVRLGSHSELFGKGKKR